jgi:hypothetical protein
MDMEDKVKPGQIYKHYKGDTYKVLILAKDSETRDWMVVYERQTDIVHDGYRITVRPLDMFLEEVDKDGYKGPRFEYISG